MSDLRIEVVRTPERLDQLREPWTALLERAAEDSVFLTYEWNRTWWEAFGRQGDGGLYVLAAWAGDELVGIAPLLRERRRVFGRTRPTIASCSNVYSDRFNLVVDRKHLEVCLAAFVEHLVENRRQWHLVQLGPMVRQSPVTEALLRVLGRAGIPHGVSSSFQSPFLALPRIWEEIVEGRRPKFRNRLRKLSRGKKLDGLSTKQTESPARVSDAMEISRHTWQHANGTGIGSTGPLKTFYTRLAERAAAAGWFRLGLATLDGRPVCFEYNLLYKNVLYNLKIGYLPEQADWSPGLFLKYHVMTQLVEAGVSEYDFLGTDEPFKLDWTSTVRPHCFVWILGRAWDVRLVGFALLQVRPWLRDHAPWLKGLRDAITSWRARSGSGRGAPSSK